MDLSKLKLIVSLKMQFINGGQSSIKARIRCRSQRNPNPTLNK
jgi:hypothetical protein